MKKKLEKHSEDEEISIRDEDESPIAQERPLENPDVDEASLCSLMILDKSNGKFDLDEMEWPVAFEWLYINSQERTLTIQLSENPKFDYFVTLM